MGNCASLPRSRRRILEDPTVPEALYTKPSGLYPTCLWDEKHVRRLILRGDLAPRYPGRDDPFGDVREECPICMLVYPDLNQTKCCNARLCTECYLQIRPPRHNKEPCPFCKRRRVEAVYLGPRDLADVEREERDSRRALAAVQATTATNTTAAAAATNAAVAAAASASAGASASASAGAGPSVPNTAISSSDNPAGTNSTITPTPPTDNNNTPARSFSFDAATGAPARDGPCASSPICSRSPLHPSSVTGTPQARYSSSIVSAASDTNNSNTAASPLRNPSSSVDPYASPYDDAPPVSSLSLHHHHHPHHQPAHYITHASSAPPRRARVCHAPTSYRCSCGRPVACGEPRLCAWCEDAGNSSGCGGIASSSGKTPIVTCGNGGVCPFDHETHFVHPDEAPEIDPLLLESMASEVSFSGAGDRPSRTVSATASASTSSSALHLLDGSWRQLKLTPVDPAEQEEHDRPSFSASISEALRRSLVDM